MLPKSIQEPAEDQNLARGGTNRGAQTCSGNGQLLSTLPLLWSAISVPLKLSIWSDPAWSTFKYKSFSLPKCPLMTMYCHPPLRRELRNGGWPQPQKSVQWKISSGKRGATGRKGAYPTLPFTWPFCSFRAGDVCGQSHTNMGWSPSTQHLNTGPGCLLGSLHPFPLPKSFRFGYDTTLTLLSLQQAALSLPIPLTPCKAHAGKPTGN